jgi:hypothetical protein
VAFRPLSSLLLCVDHLWLDGGGVWSHVHAMLWFGAAVLAATRVLQLLFGPSEARWASVLYALSSVHVLPLAFVASLYAHVTAVFALISFECLIRAAAEGSISQEGERSVSGNVPVGRFQGGSAAGASHGEGGGRQRAAPASARKVKARAGMRFARTSMSAPGRRPACSSV